MFGICVQRMLTGSSRTQLMMRSRNLAGLPKFDEASGITMKQLSPAILAIAGIYAVGIYLNPFMAMDMDPQKWKK